MERKPYVATAAALIALAFSGAEVCAQVRAQLPGRIGMSSGGMPSARGPVWGFGSRSPSSAPSMSRGLTRGDRGISRGDSSDWHRGDRDWGDSRRGDRDHVDHRRGDDRGGLTFHPGGDPALTHHRKHDHDGHHGKHDRKVIFVPTYYGYNWFYDPYYYGYGYGYGWPYWSRSLYSQIDGVYVRSAPEEEPEPVEAEEPRDPPTDAEVGAYHLRQDNAQVAILMYRKHLADNPDDTVAMRSLAVALLVDGRFTEGHAMMSMAYREDPALADDPLNPAEFFGSEREFDRTSRRCTIQANSARISGAYLTVAVLMQADGNLEASLRVLEKARREGLEVEVADALKRALGG